MKFTVKDHSDVALHTLEANMDALGEDLKDSVIDMIQNQML